MERLAFFVQHRGVFRGLNPDYDPCLFAWFPRQVCCELKAKFIMPSCSRCLRVSDTPKPSFPVVVIWGGFIQYQFWMQRAAQFRCIFPKSESHEREKCCTQRFRKCLFAHSNPLGNRIWGWIFSRQVIQALFIVTVRQGKDPETNLAQQVFTVEYCVFWFCSLFGLQLCTEYYVLLFVLVSICVSTSSCGEANQDKKIKIISLLSFFFCSQHYSLSKQVSLKTHVWGKVYFPGHLRFCLFFFSCVQSHSTPSVFFSLAAEANQLFFLYLHWSSLT